MPETSEVWLDQVVISSPCEEPWAAMRGDDRTRHCASCRLDVHNIAAMTRDEARSLFQNASGRVCARIHRRPDGTVLTTDCMPRRRRVARRLARARVALAGVLALLGLGACRGPEGDMTTTGVVRLPTGWDLDVDDMPAPHSEAGEAPTDAR